MNTHQSNALSEQAPAQQIAPAVVIGLDCITGLQTARILSQREVPVIGIAKSTTHYCCRTRVCRQIVRADTGSEELITALESLAPRLSTKAVLFPCSDASVLLLARHRDRLKDRFHIVLPPLQVAEMLMDKLSFYHYAHEKGLPLPPTFVIKNETEARQASRQLRYPCIIKPAFKTSLWESQTKSKAFKIITAEKFMAVYHQCRPWTDQLLAQEYIAGGETEHYTCNAYFDANRNPLVTFVSRKIRQWPPQTGIGCLAVECRNDRVREETVRLFSQLEYHGLAYLEMKRDVRDDQFYIIEPNIGRPTGRSAMAEAGGVELLYTMYCDALGRALPERRAQTYRGVKWIYWRRDFQSALHYWRTGELSLRQWIASWRGLKQDAVFRWRDPVPFLADLARIIPGRR